MKKRLFLFAAYCPEGRVSGADMYLLRALSHSGDVVFVADSDLDADALAPASALSIHAEGNRHGEYDFGSYKRAFEWAENRLEDYEYVYLVNDSVYGPFYPLEESLLKMESLNTDAFSLVYNPHRGNPHMQSWFIGLTREVFLSQWFSEFIKGVGKQASKEVLCIAYETGLTSLVRAHGCTCAGLYTVGGKSIYNSPRKLWRSGLPFVKKDSFRRHGGSLGAQLGTVVRSAEPELRDSIISEVGEGLLSAGPIETAERYLKYLLKKL